MSGLGCSSLRLALVVHIHGAMEWSEYDPPPTSITCGDMDRCFRIVWLWGTLSSSFSLVSAPMERYRDMSGYGWRSQYHMDEIITNSVGLCDMGPSS